MSLSQHDQNSFTRLKAQSVLQDELNSCYSYRICRSSYCRSHRIHSCLGGISGIIPSLNCPVSATCSYISFKIAPSSPIYTSGAASANSFEPALPLTCGGTTVACCCRSPSDSPPNPWVDDDCAVCCGAPKPLVVGCAAGPNAGPPSPDMLGGLGANGLLPACTPNVAIPLVWPPLAKAFGCDGSPCPILPNAEVWPAVVANGLACEDLDANGFCC